MRSSSLLLAAALAACAQSESRVGPDATYFEDIAGNSPDELYLLAIRQPILRYEGDALIVRYDGREWRTSELWTTWGLGEIVLDRERLWISDADGVAKVALADLSGTTPLARPTASADPEGFGGSIPSIGGRLWVGPSDLWLTTPTQAMRLPFGANR